MKKNIVVAAICLLSLPITAQRLTELKTDKQKLSYSIGANIAQNLKQQEMADEIDLNVLNQALNDELNETLIFSQDEMNAFMQDYFSKKRTELENKRKELGEKNKAEGQAFLAANKKKKGVVTTASGLQYEVLTKGKSTEKPKPEDVVKVKYEGRLLDGTVFDSTDKNNKGEAIEFPLNQVIKGWTEGVSLMTKGAKYRFYIPSELAYGDTGAGQNIGPNAVLIFDVELLDFKAPQGDTNN